VTEGPHAALAGEAACLAAAFLWALAVTLFRGPVETYGARTINLAKCLLATLLQGATVWAVGQAGLLIRVSPAALLSVAASGILGLVIGDTALFAAVARIGVHRTLLLQTLSPVFAALLAALWRAERINAQQVVGAAIVLLGVALVVAPRRAGSSRSREGAAPAAARIAVVGVTAGVVAALGQGGGIVLAKAGTDELPFLPASFLRLATATLGLVLIGLWSGQLGRLARIARDRYALGRALPATLLGTYLALFLMMFGVALAPASVSAVLLATSPVFSLVLEALVEKKPITARGAAGTLLAVAGVAVLTTG
jgi:drug/metabolite transporter (DMT)-like permease